MLFLLFRFFFWCIFLTLLHSYRATVCQTVGQSLMKAEKKGNMKTLQRPTITCPFFVCAISRFTVRLLGHTRGFCLIERHVAYMMSVSETERLNVTKRKTKREIMELKNKYMSKRHETSSESTINADKISSTINMGQRLLSIVLYCELTFYHFEHHFHTDSGVLITITKRFR